MRIDVVPTADTKPLLFRYAIPRISGTDIPGRYDEDAQLWVVETKNGALPIVEAGDIALLETSTFTRVLQEVDDEDISSEEAITGQRPLAALAELVTKTDVQQESDDQIDTAGLVELVTKTATVQEQDDEDWSTRALLELETKTFAEIEGDDDSPMTL